MDWMSNGLWTLPDDLKVMWAEDSRPGVKDFKYPVGSGFIDFDLHGVSYWRLRGVGLR